MFADRLTILEVWPTEIEKDMKGLKVITDRHVLKLRIDKTQGCQVTNPLVQREIGSVWRTSGQISRADWSSLHIVGRNLCVSVYSELEFKPRNKLLLNKASIRILIVKSTKKFFRDEMSTPFVVEIQFHLATAQPNPCILLGSCWQAWQSIRYFT